MKDSNQRHRPARQPEGRRPGKTARLATEFPHQHRNPVTLTRKPNHTAHGEESTVRGPQTLAERVRLYLPLVLICNSFGLIAALAVALFLVVAGLADVGTLATSISIGWSILNLIPLHVSGITLGFLPLLPALCFCALMAWRYRQAIKNRVSIKDLQVLLLLVVLVPLIISGVAHIILGFYASSEDITWSPWWEIVLRVLVLHWFALALAIPLKIWRALLKKVGLDLRISTAFLRAWRFLCCLALGGLLLFIVMLVSKFSEFTDAFTIYTGASNYMGISGLMAIAVAYLPNIVIGIAGVTLGSIFHIGETSLSLMAITYGPLPVFPTLAVLPDQESTWMLALFLIPVACAIYVYIVKAPQFLDILETGLAGIVLVVLFAFCTSGSLGVYGIAGLSLGLTSLLAAAWLIVSGFIVWVVGRWAIAHGKGIVVEVPAPEEESSHKSASVVSSQSATGLPMRRPHDSQSTSDIKSKEDSPSENAGKHESEVDAPTENKDSDAASDS